MTGMAKPDDPGAAGAPRMSAARLAAVQTLYQIDVGGARVEDALAQFLGRRRGAPLDETATTIRPNAALFAELVRGVQSRRAWLDEMLEAGLAGAWRLDRLGAVLRCILEAGACELAAGGRAPARVVISEYVALADAFYAGTQPGLVNRILDGLARRLRPDEFDGESAEGHAGGVASTAG